MGERGERRVVRALRRATPSTSLAAAGVAPARGAARSRAAVRARARARRRRRRRSEEPPRARRRAPARRVRPPRWIAASKALASEIADLHARGIATASAVWPLVALDPPGARGWQSLLGTPVDALATERVSVMMYTSILEGWSRGALRRRDATALLAAASARVARRWGARGGDVARLRRHRRARWTSPSIAIPRSSPRTSRSRAPAAATICRSSISAASSVASRPRRGSTRSRTARRCRTRARAGASRRAAALAHRDVGARQEELAADAR